MRSHNRSYAFVAAFLVLCCALAACQKATPPPAPELPALKVGIVGAVQPMGTTDLLAGFIPEERVLASSKAVTEFNTALMQTLKAQTKRQYTFIPQAAGADPTVSRTAKQHGALAYWTAVGKDMGVDVLIIPQIVSWEEREGSSAGVTRSAAVNMDFFLVDVRQEGALLSRSHFMEKQEGLSNNIMNVDVFFRRGGKWLTAQDLALEATQKMIKEFGL